MEFTEALPTEIDARLVMNWRNDPQTLKMFYHQTPKEWDSFYPEYCNEYFTNPDLFPLFGCINGQRVCFLRFNTYSDPSVSGRVVDIDINVDPQRRGQGIGKQAIQIAIEFLRENGYDAIVAEIKKQNTPSIRAFESAGFVYFDSRDRIVIDTQERVPILRYLFRLSNPAV